MSVLNCTARFLLSLTVTFFPLVVPSVYAAEPLPVSAAAPEGESADSGHMVVLRVPFSSPLFSDVPVAVLDDEVITLSDLRKEKKLIAGDKGGKTGKEDASDLLRRVITKKLINAEARNIGLDELPEIEESVNSFSRRLLTDLLLVRHLDGLNLQVDEEEVDRIYRNDVKEVRLRSVFFEEKRDAEQAAKEIAEGGDFEEIVEKMVKEGKAEGENPVFIEAEKLLPQIAEAAEQMEIGSLSDVIEVQSGFAIFRLEGVRYPDDADRKAAIRESLLGPKRRQALLDYYESLKEQYVDVKEELLEELNYDSVEEFERLLESKDVIAEIEGLDPITVGQLTKKIKWEYFHGVDRAIEEGRVNPKKKPVLEDMLRERVLRKEALRLGIEETEEYKDRVDNYRNALVFNQFVQKAIVPDIKLSEEKIRAYYDEHISEYLIPGMVKINSIVFDSRKDAAEALEKLQKGADFNWVRSNAKGQADQDDVTMYFGDNYVTMDSLPEGIREAASNASVGDVRFNEGEDGYFYILYMKDVRKPAPRPYEQVKQQIAREVFQSEIMGAVDEWAEKLREAFETEIFLEPSNGS